MPWELPFDNDVECSDGVSIFLGVVGAVGWSTVYIVSIYLGYKEKTYCIPFITLMINFAWELYFTFTDYQCLPNKWCAQRVINVCWAFLDCFIVLELLVYGYKYFEKVFDRITWYIVLLFVFGSGLTFIILFQGSFDPSGGISAFADNYLMSALFISFFYARKGLLGSNLEGQSIIIAVCKFVGTLSNSIMWGICAGHNEDILLYLYVMITLFDMYYIGLVAYTMYINSFKNGDAESEKKEVEKPDPPTTEIP